MFLIKYGPVYIAVTSSGTATAWEFENPYFKRTITEIANELYKAFPDESLILQHVTPADGAADWLLSARSPEATKYLVEVLANNKATHITRRLYVAVD